MSGEFKEKETIAKYVSSKFDYDLYHEEDDKKFPVIRIKFAYDKKTKLTKLKFFENTKNVINIDFSDLNETEIKFVQSVEGINFCLNQYKSGFKTKDKILEKIRSKVG